MTKRIIIVSENINIKLAMHVLEVAQELFEVVCIYTLNEIAPDFFGRQDISILAWEESPYTIQEFSYDYILNMNVAEAQVYEKMVTVLGVPAEQILDYQAFADRFLDETGRMLWLKKKMELRRGEADKNEGNVCIGEFTYGELHIFNERTDAAVRIGKFCSVARDVRLLAGGEHRPDWNSTYPFNVWIPEYKKISGHPSFKGDIVIGNDVWIGMGATILSGVTIGDGAVVGAQAVVSRSVLPYTIVAGNPAQPVRKRFDEETIKRLLEMQWWDWEYKDIYHAIPLLQSNDTEALWRYYLERGK